MNTPAPFFTCADGGNPAPAVPSGADTLTPAHILAAIQRADLAGYRHYSAALRVLLSQTLTRRAA